MTELTISQFCRRVDDLGWKSLILRTGKGPMNRAEVIAFAKQTPGSIPVKIRSISTGGRVGGRGASKPAYDVMMPPTPTAPLPTAPLPTAPSPTESLAERLLKST